MENWFNIYDGHQVTSFQKDMPITEPLKTSTVRLTFEGAASVSG